MPAPTASTHVFPGAHLERIQAAMPAWLSDASLARMRTLKQYGLKRLPALPAPGAPLKSAIAEHWAAQTLIDAQFDELNDVRRFAEPLLKQALAKSYGDIDVNNTFLRTYTRASVGVITPNVTGGLVSRTRSLLDAALHNFSHDETFVDHAFLGAADTQGNQPILTLAHANGGAPLTADQYKQLCRALDIGARYRRELRAALGLDEPMLAQKIQRQLSARQQADLRGAALIALARGDITQDGHDLMQALIDGQPAPRLGGQPLRCCNLALMDSVLTGVLLFIPTPAPGETLQSIIAYVPQDPEHPLKTYATPLAFVQELTRQLRNNTYQQFFSQFIAQAGRGHFFAALNARLSSVTWQEKARTDSGPTWKDTPASAPSLQFSLQVTEHDYQNRADDPTKNDLWSYLYRITLNKVLNDAADLAVSTAQADRAERQAWWDNLEKMLAQVLNAALLVLTPLVPVLGELMLAYTAYQLLDEVFEGVIDWAEGRRLEAAEYGLDALESLIEFGLFSAGGKLVEVARIKLSPFVEAMQPVVLDDGSQRLWHPDISPYAQKDLNLPQDSQPDAWGRHQHQGKQFVPFDDLHVQVQQDPQTGEHRILHPDRPEAYQPRVTFNEQGALRHEGEQPLHWDTTTLMRRLGHRVNDLDDTALERVRCISGTTAGQLRDLHLHQDPLPPLLADTLTRVEAYRYPDKASQKIRAGEPLARDPSSDWFEQTVTELDGWPRDKALKVFQKSDLTGTFHLYGAQDASAADTLTLSLPQVMSGKLPEQVLEFLDDDAIHTLLGAQLPADKQVQALRDLIADHVLGQRSDITRHVHRAWQHSDDPHRQQLAKAFPDLGAQMAQTLLDSVPQDLRGSLRVENEARELAFTSQTAQAFEGFYQATLITPRTEQLVLNTLRQHNDWFVDMRLEIRESTATGTLRSSVGPQDASISRTLVHNSDATYGEFDAGQNRLKPSASLYEAILQALTPRQRQAIGYAPGQGPQLRQWLIRHLEPLAQRRQVLAQPPVRRVADQQTLTLLGGPQPSRLRASTEPTTEAHARDNLHVLFPSLSEDKVTQFIDAIGLTQMRATLAELTAQKQQLYHDLETWKTTPALRADSKPEARIQAVRKKHLAKLLYRKWEDRFAKHLDEWGNEQSGARLDLRLLTLPDSLPPLGRYFEHVTSLLATGTRFSDAHAPLLKALPSLRVLKLGHNRLTRLPREIEGLRLLRQLDLSHNDLTLVPPDISRLANLRSLEVLALNNTALALAPDISKMPLLRQVNLSSTPLTHWPTGLLALPRPRNFELDLRNTLIESLPVARSDTDEVRTLSRTRLDRNRLNDDDRQRYEAYRRASGLDPERTYEPRGDSNPWLEDSDEPNRQALEALWDEVEREHGSQGFFEVIKFQEAPDAFEDTEDEQRYFSHYPELKTRVWRMLHAAHSDAPLREKLFRMSSFPGLCADGGAQIFNEMGIEVLAYEAGRDAMSSQDLGQRLALLGRGTARFKQLAKVIQEDVAHRLRPVAEGGLGQRLRAQLRDGVPGEVDEVEIYLAYQTSLAASLDLPWVSEHMLYRRTARVTDQQIDQARQTVLDLGEGDGLVNQMVLEPFWHDYLRASHSEEYAQNDQAYSQKFFQLDDLQTAQAQWAETPTSAHRESLKKLAEALEVPESVVFSGEPLSDELYNRLLNDLGYSSQEWLRRLTREALTEIRTGVLRAD